MSDDHQDQADKAIEVTCGVVHASLEEAMVHAEVALGFRDRATKSLIVHLKPYLGSTRYNSGTIVGWQVGAKRFRADLQTREAKARDERRAAAAGRAPIYKGLHGVHVNEEDFSALTPRKVCHATESPVVVLEHVWRRWSSKYGRPGTVTEHDIEIVDGVKGR